MKLGEILIQKKLITATQLETALEEQKLCRDFLGVILVRTRVIREEDLARVLSEQFHIPVVDLKRQPIEWSLAMRFSPSIVVYHQCLPVFQTEREITVAITNPLDVEGISKIEEQAKGLRVRLVLTVPSDMQQTLMIYNTKMQDKIRKMLEG